jgi:hypothetical protein
MLEKSCGGCYTNPRKNCVLLDMKKLEKANNCVILHVRVLAAFVLVHSHRIFHHGMSHICGKKGFKRFPLLYICHCSLIVFTKHVISSSSLTHINAFCAGLLLPLPPGLLHSS